MPPVLEESKAIAGHMPAEKIGGMRVVRKDRKQSENENTTPVEGGSESGKSDEMKQAENVLANSGLAAQTNKDYPAEAVRHCHDKPVPRHQPHDTINNAHVTRANQQIFQPTKK